MVSMIPQKAEDNIGVLPRHLGFETLELPDSECSAMNSYLDNFFFWRIGLLSISESHCSMVIILFIILFPPQFA